jgi:hypothetical protein
MNTKKIIIDDMNDPLKAAQQMMEALWNVGDKLDSLNPPNGSEFIFHITGMCLMLLANRSEDKEAFKTEFFKLIEDIANKEKKAPLQS